MQITKSLFKLGAVIMPLLITILFTCKVFPVHATDVDVASINIDSFEGGLNTRDGAGGIADNELIDSENCYLDYKGITKRAGYERYTSTNRVDSVNAGTGIINVPFTAGDMIVATAGTKIARKSGTTWIDITGYKDWSGSNNTCFTVVNNILFGVNGVNTPFYFTGSDTVQTLVGVNIPTAPTVCESFHGRLFLAEGRRLYWSNYMADCLTFHPDDWQDFNEPITGLKVLGDANSSMLIVLCKSSIHYLTYDPSTGANAGGRGIFIVDVISNVHGCVSPYSVQECVTPEGNLILIWADTDGLKMLTTELTIVKITDKIDPTWQELSSSYLSQSVGVHYKTKRWYVLFVRSGSGNNNDTEIIYDLRNWCIAGIFDWSVSAANVLKISGKDILVGSDYSGYWNKYDTGTDDNGTAIDAYFTTKTYDAGAPLVNKMFKSVNLQYAYLGLDSLDIETFFDIDISSYKFTSSYVSRGSFKGLDDFVLDESLLGGSGDLVLSGVQLAGTGRSIQFRFRNDKLTGQFKIYKIKITYEPGRMVLYK